MSTSVYSASKPSHLQTTLACDLSESLAVLARSFCHNFLSHRDVILALEARAGQPVTEVLLQIVSASMRNAMGNDKFKT
jgi:hypothetical protein